MSEISLEYLDNERKLLWKEVLSLKDQMTSIDESRLPEDPNLLINGLSIKASKAYNRVNDRAQKISESCDKIDELLTKITSAAQEVASNHSNVSKDSDAVSKRAKELSDKLGEVDGAVGDAQKRLKEIADISAGLQERQKTVDILESQAESNAEAVEQSRDKAEKAYTDINTTHRAIFGYTNTEGERVDGKKQDLETAYEQLKADFADLKAENDASRQEFLDSSKQLLGDSKAEVDSIVATLKSLLPKGLTAGLSHAYFEKREKEELEQVKTLTMFKWCIRGLVGLALIPVLLSVYFIRYTDMSILDILALLPKEAACIIPLYLPVLWLAVFSNKRLNLSKRLIEEYSHKEVVSKTYEGLATQIENMENDEVKKELRARLLYNTVRLSETNPGELIKNYGSSDNPLLDMLEKSEKLSDAIDKVASIPGLSAITAILNKSPEATAGNNKELTSAGDGN